jgi:4-hydroxybenzoate polyprenyltransferase
MERGRVMGNYNIPKEISTKLKINKSLYLFDLLFIICLLIVMMMLGFFIHPIIQTPFYVFMGILGLLMIVRPSTNPPKWMYEALLLTLVRKKSTYCAVDREQE